MKILLLGDASNYHRTLASGLIRAGHSVTVASNGSRWMDTARDVDISRREGRLGGALLWLKLNTLLWPQLRGYDVVQLCGVVFVEQKPGRVKAFFDRLRRGNGSVFLTALAADPQYVEMCTSADCPLRYNEWQAYGQPTPYATANPALLRSWLDRDISDLCRHVYDHVDGVATALYEYHVSCSRLFDAERMVYTGIPIDTLALQYMPGTDNYDRLRVMWACHKGREAEKGADRMLTVLRELQEEYPDRMHLDIVQNLPYAQFKDSLDSAHVVVDQLYSYSPATTALMAMAKGKIAITGGEPEYYDFIGERSLHPIINPDPRDPSNIKEQIRMLIDNPHQLSQMSAESRVFVEKHNSADVVAARFERLWDKTLRHL